MFYSDHILTQIVAKSGDGKLFWSNLKYIPLQFLESLFPTQGNQFSVELRVDQYKWIVTILPGTEALGIKGFCWKFPCDFCSPVNGIFNSTQMHITSV